MATEVTRICEKCGDDVGTAWLELYGVRTCRECVEFWATGNVKNNPEKEIRLRIMMIEQAKSILGEN